MNVTPHLGAPWIQVAKFAYEAVSAANGVRVDNDDPDMGFVNIRAR